MKRVVSILGFFVLMTAGAAQAQDHEGFWVGFGLGAGSLGIDGGTGRDTGVMGYLKLRRYDQRKVPTRCGIKRMDEGRNWG